MMTHQSGNAIATLLCSQRNSSRKLVFDNDSILKAWHNLSTNEYRPNEIQINDDDIELSFSGIHVMSLECFDKMLDNEFRESFPIMDFYLSQTDTKRIIGYNSDKLQLLDIGKPESLQQADNFVNNIIK